MDENAINAKQSNLLLAILTAIGMGLIGCLLWGLFYYWGFIAWVAAYVVVIAAGWGYQKFNLKMDGKGYIIIAIISIAEIILTMLVAINISCMQVLKEAGVSISFFECFGKMMEVIGTNSEAKAAVVRDGVLSAIFIGVGILTYYLVLKNKAKQEAAKAAKQDQTASVEVSINQETNADVTSAGKQEYKLVLTDAGDNKMEVIKILRSATGLDLATTKNLVESAPCVIKVEMTEADAEDVVSQIKAIGADVTLSM